MFVRATHSALLTGDLAPRPQASRALWKALACLLIGDDGARGRPGGKPPAPLGLRMSSRGSAPVPALMTRRSRFLSPSLEGTVMAPNEELAELSKAGVAVWLDDLSRDRIRSGDLQSLVDDYSVVGVTTNPTIFAAAISGSDSYDDQVHAMAVRKISVGEALRTITAADVRDACDLLAPVAQRTGRDGRVSLEVAPGLAHDTDATAAEAAHLWWLVDRPNLFIKIPATQEGLAAITTSIAQGISVNVTLIFSPERYRAVMDAYLSGLEQRVQDGGSLTGIESVASFFVSRVDTEIDKRLEKAGADPSLKGKAALANAQLAYQAYQEVFSSGRWRALEAQGASTQRPLWASTGVKSQDYPDTLYVSGLIAPDTATPCRRKP